VGNVDSSDVVGTVVVAVVLGGEVVVSAVVARTGTVVLSGEVNDVVLAGSGDVVVSADVAATVGVVVTGGTLLLLMDWTAAPFT